MAAVQDISVLPWSTVTDVAGNSRADLPFTIKKAGVTVLSGVTDAAGQMNGNLEAAEYTVTVAGITKTVQVPPKLNDSGHIQVPNSKGMLSEGFLVLESGAADQSIIFRNGVGAERARFNASSAFVLGPPEKLTWAANNGANDPDTNLYRLSAGVLATDGTLNVGGSLNTGTFVNLPAGGDINWGGDAHLTRVVSGSLPFTAVTNGFNFPNAISSGAVGNNSLFRDASTGKLAYKDNGGVVNQLY
jgi:hypothetical protein